MKPELKAELARLGPGQGIDLVQCGSPADLIIRWAGSIQEIKTIPGILALRRRHTELAKAKRAVELMVDTGEAVIHVPMVEDQEALDANCAPQVSPPTAFPMTKPISRSCADGSASPRSNSRCGMALISMPSRIGSRAVVGPIRRREAIFASSPPVPRKPVRHLKSPW